jgi:hypothetical protein
MKLSIRKLPIAAMLAGVSLSAAPISGGLTLLGYDQALSAPGGGHGGGNGKGNGNGGGGMGALNAAHASPQGMAHTNANSQVGKIAAYNAELKLECAASTACSAALKAYQADPTAANKAALIAAENTLMQASTKLQQLLQAAAKKTTVVSSVIDTLDSLLLGK